jgi:hypothetical protein
MLAAQRVPAQEEYIDPLLRSGWQLGTLNSETAPSTRKTVDG